MPSPSIIPYSPIQNHFHAEHRRLSDLFDHILGSLAADDWTQAEALWKMFATWLTAHLDTEDHFLVPTLTNASKPDAQGILLEHAEIRASLVKLGEAIQDHTARVDEANTFLQVLNAHAAHEEAVLFH